MNRDQTSEYVVAFVVGAMIGVGAALLLAPDPPTRRQKLMKELKPYGKRIRKGAAGARRQVGHQAGAAARYGEELMAASRSAISELRGEVADLVTEARREIATAVEQQLAAAHKRARRAARR